MREGLTCRRWGKKTKSKTQPLQVYILRRAWEKSHDESHDLRSHDELKIDDDIIKRDHQIRNFDAYVSRSCDLLKSRKCQIK